MNTEVKKIERMIGCGKPSPKLGKRETEIEAYLQESDFNKPEDFQALSGGEDEITVQVSGQAEFYRPGTYEDPPEGGYSEDVVVWLGNEGVTDLIKETIYERICEKHYEEAEENRRGYGD